MKVTITHLKAPWPAGAKPGDVVELNGDAPRAKPEGDEAPAEAPAGDGEAATAALNAADASVARSDLSHKRRRALRKLIGDAEALREEARKALDALDAHITLASPGLRHFVTAEETKEARASLANLRALVAKLAAACGEDPR